MEVAQNPGFSHGSKISFLMNITNQTSECFQLQPERLSCLRLSCLSKTFFFKC